MANKLFTIAGGSSGAAPDDMEVYVDIDVDSKSSFRPNFALCMKDFYDFALSGLSGVALSAGNDISAPSAIEEYGACSEWLKRNELSLFHEFRSESLFLPGDLSSYISAICYILSVDVFTDKNRYITSQTVSDISGAVQGYAGLMVNMNESRSSRWRYDVSKLVNVNAVKNSIKQIFTWIPGERIINPEFGSLLRKYLYEPITEENQERIVAEIKSCVLRWEPRVIVDRVVKATDIDDIEENTVRLDIYYRIKGLNEQQFVYQYEYSRSKYSYI